MIGIYKITNPKGRVYIGQSIYIERRLKEYSNVNKGKGQVRLYNSIVKYGFSQHIFEVIEECTIEQLNERERYWQEFYDVLTKKGLNCMLQGTDEAKAIRSQEANDKQSLNRITFYQSPEGIQARVSQSIKQKEFYQTSEGKENRRKASANTDYSAFQAKKISNTDYAAIMSKINWEARTANTNYDSFQAKRIANTDFKAKSANTNYAAMAEKNRKSITQYEKDGRFIRIWSSGTEVEQTLGISGGNISACCRGKLKSAGGFIWKYVK
jgi:group I intron endonuclease